MLIKQFESLLCELIRNRPRPSSEKQHSTDNDQLVHMLEKALIEGKITDKQYRDNLKITFIVAHENTQLLLNSMFYAINMTQVSTLRVIFSTAKDISCTNV